MTKRSIASKKLWMLGNRDFNTQYFDFNKEGDLIIKEGHNIYNVKYLAEKFGTPLEILMPFVVEERVEDLLDLVSVLSKKIKYKGKFFYHYPMKVNQNREVVMAIVGEGAHLETSSYNELWHVKKMLEQEKFNPEIRIFCSGPKTDNYIDLIDDLQRKGVKIFPLIEGPNELKFLQYSKYEVGIRLNMPVKANSHWNKTISHFGFSAKEILKMDSFKNLKILNYHLGSQIEKLSDILIPIKYALDVYFKLKEKNPTLDTLDIGGGMPIPYTRDIGYPVEKIMERIIKLIKRESDKRGVPHPNIVSEWGRYIVAPAQISVFKVINTKNILNKKSQAKKWYIIDGCIMNDLLDTWAIGQKWSVSPVNNKRDSHLNDVWLAGSSCDSDDTYMGVDGSIPLPDFDINKANNQPLYLVFYDTGAYENSLAAKHCMISSPMKIVIENGHIVVARKRELPDDVGRCFGW